MANELRLGLPSSGNDLHLTPPGYALGYVTDEDVLVAIPPTEGVVLDADFIAGVGKSVFEADGSVSDTDTIVGEGQSNIGYGAISDQDIIVCDTALAVAAVSDSDTISGEGDDTFRFTPTKVWPGYTSDGTNITIPITDLAPWLTAAEANAVSGSWLEIQQALMMSVDAYYASLRSGYRPRTLRMRVFDDWNYNHKALGRVLRRQTWLKIYLKHATREVADEV